MVPFLYLLRDFTSARLDEASFNHEIYRVLSIFDLKKAFASGQHVGFVVDKAALGQGFSEYFGFHCQSFQQFLHHHNHPGLEH
jgi:hypothetical protein